MTDVLGDLEQFKEHALRRVGEHRRTCRPCRTRRCADAFELIKQFAESHEAIVHHLLERADWVCDPWGQGLLSPRMRAALRRTHSPVRWAPDLLAVKGDRWCFVDGKAETNKSTPNFSLEVDAFTAHFNWWVGNTMGRINFIYVWDDLRVSSINMVSRGINEGWVRRGEFQGEGSGTPFLLIPKARTKPFHVAFGGKEIVL